MRSWKVRINNREIRNPVAKVIAGALITIFVLLRWTVALIVTIVGAATFFVAMACLAPLDILLKKLGRRGFIVTESIIKMSFGLDAFFKQVVSTT